MDPNDVQRKMLECALRLQQAADADELGWDDIEDAVGLADHVIALHDWLTNGGYLPDTWSGR